MLGRVHADRSFADGGRALDGFYVGDRRVNCRFFLEIFAFKFDPEVRGRGLKFQRDLRAGMERGAAHRRGFGERVLKLSSRGHGALSNRDRGEWPEWFALDALERSG